MAKKKIKKIVPYRKPMNINIGMIIFAFIFVYLLFNVYTYSKRTKIEFYEVVEGTIVNDKQYTGIILRNEEVHSTDRAGHINFYVREGKRASVGTRVYSIDESGTMASMLIAKSDGENALSLDNLTNLKKQLSSFSLSFSEMQFDKVYDVKYELEAAVIEAVNLSALENLDSALNEMGVNFQQVRAGTSGIVSYTIDTYLDATSGQQLPFESLTEDQITAALFDKSNYDIQIVKSGDLIESGINVYRLVKDENWFIVFPITEGDKAAYGGETSLKISFNGEDLQTNADFQLITGADGATYGKLSLSKYMVQFISDRYIEFEIMSNKTDGLKIPSSAVLSKDFYTIPLNYLSNGGDSSNSGFYKEIYSEAGTTMEFIPTTLYNATDELYYIDTEDFQAGDYIIKPESNERYQIGTTASLQGVYNINKGYSTFKKIDIISSNDEYYTVKKGTSYGIAMYDHIVLDATTVEENMPIYN